MSTIVRLRHDTRTRQTKLQEEGVVPENPDEIENQQAHKFVPAPSSLEFVKEESYKVLKDTKDAASGLKDSTVKAFGDLKEGPIDFVKDNSVGFFRSIKNFLKVSYEHHTLWINDCLEAQNKEVSDNLSSMNWAAYTYVQLLRAVRGVLLYAVAVLGIGMDMLSMLILYLLDPQSTFTKLAVTAFTLTLSVCAYKYHMSAIHTVLYVFRLIGRLVVACCSFLRALFVLSTSKPGNRSKKLLFEFEQEPVDQVRRYYGEQDEQQQQSAVPIPTASAFSNPLKKGAGKTQKPKEDTLKTTAELPSSDDTRTEWGCGPNSSYSASFGTVALCAVILTLFI
jgi:hypothetical protein